VLQGAVLTFFAFIGFEDILNVSEEVVRPERNVPLGLIGAMVFSTLVYLAVAVTSVSVLPWETLARSNAPLMDVARAAAPWFRGIDGVFLGITVFSIGNTALLNYLMGSRLLFGMSRQGLLPSFLGQVNRTTRTPDAAILVLFAIVSALIAAGGIRQLAEATVLLLLSVVAVVNAALLALKRRPEEPPGRFEVPAAIPALGCAVCVGLLLSRCLHAVASGDPSARVAPLVAGGIVAGSLVLFLAFGGPRRSGGR
jgi:amino acid transporter